MVHVKLKFMSLATNLAFGIFTSNDRGGVHGSCNNFFRRLCTIIFFVF